MVEDASEGNDIEQSGGIPAVVRLVGRLAVPLLPPSRQREWRAARGRRPGGA